MLLFARKASAVCAPARGLRVTKKSRKGGDGAISFALCGLHLKKCGLYNKRGTCTSTKNSVKLIAPLSSLRDGRMPSGASPNRRKDAAASELARFHS